MPRTFTWLHLSDLHACRPKSGWDAKRVLETLRTDLFRSVCAEHQDFIAIFDKVDMSFPDFMPSFFIADHDGGTGYNCFTGFGLHF
jgi:hypothetical protein